MQTKQLPLKYKKIPLNSTSDIYTQLYPENKNLRYYKEITFQITDDCCMACTYCYQHNKGHHQMPFNVAKTFIDKLLNDEYEEINSANTMGIALDFIGGEPLMEVELMKNIWEYYLNKLIELHHPWLPTARFSICTNGLLYFKKDFQDFIQKYHHYCSLTFSIDGNKELHDSCRVDLQGKGTYDRAVAAMQHYKRISGTTPPTKMTLSPQNISFTKEAIINLINLGYTNINLNCIFEKGWENSHAVVFYNQLKSLTDYLIENHLYDKIYLSIFDEDYFKPMSENDNNNWCGGVCDERSGLAIDWKGNIFPCLRYMESSLNGTQEALSLGNVFYGFFKTEDELKHKKLLSNITRRSQSTDKCFYCPIAKGCAWCSGYCYECNGTPNCRTTNICIMHQARALANCYYWNKVYEKIKLDKHFVNHVPDEWALKIISRKELEEIKKWSMF